MRKKILCSLVAAVLVGGLAVGMGGCGKQPESGPATPGEGTQEGSAALRFIDVSPSPTRQEYFEKMFAQFAQETGNTVSYESVPWDEAANKLTVLGSANQLPDVITTWAGWLGQFVPAGWVIPLSDYISDSRDEYTELVKNVNFKTEEEMHGAVYTIPDGVMVKGVYVRKDWCEEIGFELGDEWTYDEYFDLVAKLTDVGQKRYGASYRGARGAFDPLLVYLESFNGGRLYDDQGNSLIASPECVTAFEKWTDVYLSGSAPKEAIGWGFVEMVDNFTGGLTGTLINDSEVAATCQQNMQPDQWTVMPMPKSTKDGKIYNTVNSPYAYSISGHSQAPDQAWKLIEFLTRPDNNIEYCKLVGLIPVKKDVAGDDTYGENGPYAVFVRQLNDPDLVVPCAFGPFDYTELHQGMFHEEIQKYLLRQKPAEQALGNISAELEKRMKEYLAENPGAVVETPKAVG